jgi:signal transduction histidine kinase
MISTPGDRKKILTIFLMVVGISGLHLFVSHDFEKGHIIARELYFLPIILSAFWFGLRGAVITSLSITFFYLSYAAVHWQGFTPDDLDRLLEIALFNIVAITTGFLQDRQRKEAAEKLTSIKAMAGTVAHEINSPLFVAMGTLDLLRDDLDEKSELYQEIAAVLKNLDEIKILVKRISRIEEVVTTDYDTTTKIVDLDKSAPAS